jgi:endonuclease YncB( thermonuclease family)
MFKNIFNCFNSSVKNSPTVFSQNYSSKNYNLFKFYSLFIKPKSKVKLEPTLKPTYEVKLEPIPEVETQLEQEPELKSVIILWNDTVQFIPPIYEGQVIKVYDGDTVTIAAKMPYNSSPLYRFSVRLSGIDSPEIKGKSPAEKEAAIIARDALEKLILHKKITLKNHKTEKYGRILADIYLNDLHLNKWMLDNGYAIPYDGKTKQVFRE